MGEAPWTNLKRLLLLLLISFPLLGQERKVDPTWLHRFVPRVSEASTEISSPTCHYKPIFGEGDAESRTLKSVSRFAEVTIDAQGNCQSIRYDREEEICFVQEGQATLHYGDQSYGLRSNDFTYLPPGMKHALGNSSEKAARVLVMGFRIPSTITIMTPSATPKIVNLDSVKEETVSGHPSSVLYKLLVGPRTAKRDAIDDAYVVVSLFLMDFAPGGTNFPHHHESAEEIYLVLDGEGDMVAGGGMDGIEGRHPTQAGDAYYFRPNCTVGFYNQEKAGAKAHILAVRSRVRLEEPD